jgi:hypothetical protein
MIRRIILLLIFLFFMSVPMTKAQQTTPTPEAAEDRRRPGFYTPNVLGTCSQPFPFPTDTPEPYCQPGYTPNDTFPYIVPCRDTTDRNTCRTAEGAAIGDGFAHLNVDSRNYKSGNYVIQTSNQKSLLYEVQGNNIMFIQDTTWSNSATCHNGKLAFQRINGRSGMLWAPRSLSCAPNNSFASSGTNAAFEYSEDQEEALRLLPDNVTPCSANYTGDVSGTKQLIFNGSARCNSFRGDILVLRNVTGAGAGEVFVYCKGVGLCGWYQNIDFSKPENNPRNWVDKDICSGTAFGHDYGACYVGCHQQGINQPVQLSVSDTLRQVLSKGVFGINLLAVEPAEGEHKIPLKPQNHLQNTIRSMLSSQYKIQPKGAPTPQTGPEEKILRLNQDNVSMTMVSNIRTEGSVIESNADGDGAQAGGNEQLITSQETLWNTKDAKDARLQDDLQGGLSAISSINTLSANKPEGIDLTKRDNRLADRIIVPCNASSMTRTDSTDSAPENRNVFQVPQGGIILNVLSGLADILGAIAEGLGVTVNNTLCTCTKISNEEDLYNNVKTATYSFFPDQVVQKLNRLTKNGEEDNPYTNPVQGSGGSTISITQSYAYTNFVNTANDAQKCSALPFNSRQWNQLCANDEIANPVGMTTPP